jgi:hypothetical protein
VHSPVEDVTIVLGLGVEATEERLHAIWVAVDAPTSDHGVNLLRNGSDTVGLATVTVTGATAAITPEVEVVNETMHAIEAEADALVNIEGAVLRLEKIEGEDPESETPDATGVARELAGATWHTAREDAQGLWTGDAIDLILTTVRLVSMVGVTNRVTAGGTELDHEVTLVHFGIEGTDPGGDHDPLAQDLKLTVAIRRGIIVGTRAQESACIAETGPLLQGAQRLSMLPGMNLIEHHEFQILPCRQDSMGQIALALFTPSVVHDESEHPTAGDHPMSHKLQKIPQLDMPLGTSHIEHQEFLS